MRLPCLTARTLSAGEVVGSGVVDRVCVARGCGEEAVTGEFEKNSIEKRFTYR